MFMHRASQSLPPVQSPYKKQLVDIARMANYQPVPSIPTINNDFNFTYAKEGYLKRKPRHLHQSINLEDVRNAPQHSPQYPRLPKMDSKLSKSTQPSDFKELKENLLTLDTRVETQDYLAGSSLRYGSAQQPQSPASMVRERKRNQRHELKHKINQEQSQSQDQYDTEATPGPGYYSQCSNSIFNKSSKSILSNFSFGSRECRFKDRQKQKESFSQAKKNPEQRPVNPQQERHYVRKRKIVPFLSKSPKNIDEAGKEQCPGPQDYLVRVSIEDELIKKIQRNFRGSFGICEQRFKCDYGYQNVGPGAYLTDNQSLKQVDKLGSFFFLSQKRRFQ